MGGSVRSRPVKFALSIALAGLLGACTANFHEVHHLKTVDELDQPVNYYRISIDGSSAGGSARYISGFFDTKAVEKYFNEFKQPKDGAFIDYSTPATTVKTMSDKDLSKASLVMLLSTNTDAVAQGISNLARTQELQCSLAQLAAKDKIEANGAASSELAGVESHAVYLEKKGTAVIGGLPAGASEATVKSSFLDYANSLASFLGHKGQFKDLTEVADWLSGKE